MADDDLMTVLEVLDVLKGVSRRTFYRWRELGIAPACIRLPNGELRIVRRDLRDWLEQHREAA
ncbi:helix-turn-helix transcriptional regulator [Actinoplanes teichomyceticus]|uniref:Helix-turn-helix protein n=1 Tax=Actinoplanes teichomyceticus TaxID=1867 RepID=A0A561VQY9_ACTTI|nr:helix-turn-helix domain-containing protein [Actinoplanes teichomyceticus]TWG14022.1 helix-turn-helix protein [Actinoplanes teichomyceticus]